MPYRRVPIVMRPQTCVLIDNTSDMAKKATTEKTATGKKQKIVNPNAAGIDIAASEMQVCVPEDRDGECNLTRHRTNLLQSSS